MEVGLQGVGEVGEVGGGATKISDRKESATWGFQLTMLFDGCLVFARHL